MPDGLQRAREQAARQQDPEDAPPVLASPSASPSSEEAEARAPPAGQAPGAGPCPLGHWVQGGNGGSGPTPRRETAFFIRITRIIDSQLSNNFY